MAWHLTTCNDTGGKSEVDGTFSHQGSNQKRAINSGAVDHMYDMQTNFDAATIDGGLGATVVGWFMPVRGAFVKTIAKDLNKNSRTVLLEDNKGSCRGLSAQRHSGYGALRQVADFDKLWAHERPDAPDYTFRLQVCFSVSI